ncbi:hypothetical protein JTB14_018574 [Gonioctena quinquepunctata]|nr:hypothetical protein JTB14_018574 [Gonioctena quinquepunctata]
MSDESGGGTPPIKRLFTGLLDHIDNIDMFSGDSDDNEVDKILNSQRDLASLDSLTSSKKIPNILGSDVSRSANNLQKTNEINMVNSEKQRENNESREVLYYKEGAIGPFIVVIESTEKSGNIARGYQAYIPYNNVTSKGIIRGIENSFTEEEIISMINSPFRVLGIRRMNRRDKERGEIKYIPTSTILITFEGVVLPKYVKMYYMTYSVHTYIPPVTQCFQCLMYGHTKKQCKGKRRCFNCSDIHESEEGYANCVKIRCHNCKSLHHKTNSKDCGEYERQINIRKRMSFENKSFFEIAQEIPRVSIDNAQDPRDFPRLREKSAPQINRIEISEREETYNKSLSNNKRNYSQILKNKGRNERSGFDRQALNEALFYPNGQIPQPNNGVLFKRNMDKNYSGEGPSNIETGHPTINRPISAPQENIKEEQYIIKQFYDLFTEIPENIKPKIINLINSLDIFKDRQNLNASHSSSAEEY